MSGGRWRREACVAIGCGGLPVARAGTLIGTRERGGVYKEKQSRDRFHNLSLPPLHHPPSQWCWRGTVSAVGELSNKGERDKEVGDEEKKRFSPSARKTSEKGGASLWCLSVRGFVRALVFFFQRFRDH